MTYPEWYKYYLNFYHPLLYMNLTITGRYFGYKQFLKTFLEQFEIFISLVFLSVKFQVLQKAQLMQIKMSVTWLHLSSDKRIKIRKIES